MFAPSLFKTRTFAVGILGNLFARLGSGALPFLVPLLLQVALGYSPSQAGMSMLPLAAAAMFAKSIARPLIERLGYRIVLTGNTLALGVMLAALGLVTEHTPYPLLLGMLAIAGAINSLQFTAMNTVTLIDLDDKAASSGNSLLSVVAQLSLSLGVACLPTDLPHRGHHGDAGGDDLPAALTPGRSPGAGGTGAAYRALTAMVPTGPLVVLRQAPGYLATFRPEVTD